MFVGLSRLTGTTLPSLELSDPPSLEPELEELSSPLSLLSDELSSEEGSELFRRARMRRDPDVVSRYGKKGCSVAELMVSAE